MVAPVGGARLPTTDHNRDSTNSIDCQEDPKNQPEGSPEGLCDDFRFSNFNGPNTELQFGLGTGSNNDAPNYEDPKDMGVDEEVGDNIYKIEVRAAFATLRSSQY